VGGQRPVARQPPEVAHSQLPLSSGGKLQDYPKLVLPVTGYCL
jgi:hypothetical protein